MGSFVLTWNPDKEWEGSPLHRDRWATGARKSGIFRGDRLYLLRQGSDRGVVAFGLATGPIFRARGGAGWPDPEAIHNYVGVTWLRWILDHPVPIEALKEAAPGFYWRSAASGHQLKDKDAHAVGGLFREAVRLPG